MLAESGAADPARLPGAEQLAVRCGQNGHHHHLVCRDGGRTVKVAGPVVKL
ncbi:hypothetical protein [Micromonospora musae]|uniref:hypothetical protein n=1 Tax=Micromonospora musae TaxID=1894970 RepID=UPI001F254BEF|nr:hypothetical protein [Micromonospora musae]